MLTLLVLIILVVAVVGALPVFPYSRTYGYAPSGGLGVVLLIVVLWLLLGHRL